MPTIGKAAPAFTLETDTGETLALKDLKGKTVVLFFYPKDDTSGCTTEACEFRDLMPRFKKGSAVILGISPDSVKSHQKFKAKYDLPFTLLADTDHAMADAYGVYGEKEWMGKKFMGADRKTFLIDEQGRIKKVFDKVNVEQHADEVMQAFG